MREQLGQAGMCDVQACLDGGAVKIEPQRHNVDEQAHRAAAPAPPCMRPNSTVPNTTCSRPLLRATTSPTRGGRGSPASHQAVAPGRAPAHPAAASAVPP